jgi:hypothetical protein
MGDSRIKDISSLLNSFFDADKLKQGEKYSAFFSSWKELVGERFAAHTRVVDIDKGLLVIEAEHPGWIQLLQIRQSGILAEVARRYPELGLRGIVFRLSGHGGAGMARATPSGEAMPDPDSLGETESDSAAGNAPMIENLAAEDIKDPEFLALFSSLRKAMRGKG